MNVEMLSRIQFAFTAAFHYLYPPLSIGLGIVLVMMEGIWLRTRNPIYHNMARFWTKIFGLIFGLGVATGIVLEFEFGTNWATYSRFVGDIFGSALAAEGIFAFFLESGFLAILLFGWDKVGPKLHFFATCMVALGAHFSAVWIIVANSWQQTPAGSHLEIGGHPVPLGHAFEAADLGRARMVIDDFWGVVFNPSSMDRLSHTLVAAWLAGAFLVISVAALSRLQQPPSSLAWCSRWPRPCYPWLPGIAPRAEWPRTSHQNWRRWKASGKRKGKHRCIPSAGWTRFTGTLRDRRFRRASACWLRGEATM